MLVFGIALQVCVPRPMIGEPVISVIMVTIGLSMVFQAAMKWIFGKPAAVADLPVAERERARPANADRLPDEPDGVGGDDGCNGVVLPVVQARPCDARHRIRPAGGTVARHLGEGCVRHGVGDLGGGVAVAGVVVAVVNGVSAGLSVYIKVFPAVILGGLDSIVGAVLGGIIIGLLENLAHFVDSQYLHWGNLYEIAPFYVLIIILMIKPYGLFGTRDIERI